MDDFVFPFPFTNFEAYNGDGDTALTLVDLRMIELSYALRCKPSWWTKIKDPAIRSKWKAEALEHEIQGDKLKDTEIEWVLDELEDYALMRDEETGIQPSCYVRIWESDELISQDLHSKLKLAAAVLENVPEEEKDWHPRSNNQVLDLVHPSLFCAVYGRTQCWSTSNGARSLKLLEYPDEDLDDWSYSEMFSWIPTDFELGDDGAPATALGYINNIHPQHHKDLIAVIESLVGRFSLLWDKVLTDIYPPNKYSLPGRARVPSYPSYTWTNHPEHPPPPWQDRQAIGDEEFNRRYQAWQNHKIITLPTVDECGYRGSGEDITDRYITYSIQGTCVQVIVKLANIHLTPEKPEYPGGAWHVEGMANERIVSSGIYYYDCENVTDSQLAFRMGVNFEGTRYEQADSTGIRLTWGMEYGQPSNQVVGAVKTCVNRCIAFPNIYQHQVSSFRLVDPTKPGHRKIVALFLVDPENRIPSTTDIPPQQTHWAREAIHDVLVKDQHRLKTPLPVEVVDMVVDRVDNVMTLAEAKAYREQLMDERTAFSPLYSQLQLGTTLFGVVLSVASMASVAVPRATLAPVTAFTEVLPTSHSSLCKESTSSAMATIEFPFPFTNGEDINSSSDPALPLVDLRMIELSYALRCKNSWWTKINDPDIRSKWEEEASGQTIRGGELNEAEIEWALDELEDYATMRDEVTGIQPSCHVRVWESDALISKELRSKLISAAAVLENVPEDEKDWHPRSDNLVLDLVHPSLFCAVYERTQCWDTVDGKKILGPLRLTHSDLPEWAYSKRFSWIPTDFQVGHDGTPARALGYINNVHPQTHKELVPLIEAFVGRFSLLWDRVLTDIHPDNNEDLPGRKKTDGMYVWLDSEEHPKPPSWSDRGSMSKEEYNKLDQAYEENRTIGLPWVNENGYHESGQDVTERNATYSIQGKTVQVIVKLANIHLSPDKPEYPGGNWHVEGMANERIVASGIYYYDCSNITDSHITFRVAVNFETNQYEQSDGEGIGLTWGLEYGQDSNQVVGAVKTSVNRCISFPNIYQHQVSSFKLVDPTKPGYRKILALFLVDPETRVPSTTDIPPQQSHWTRQALYESFVQGDHGVKVPLPQELADMVVDNVDSVMTLGEAKAYREQLMDERTALVGEVNKQHFCTEFNFCEH